MARMGKKIREAKGSSNGNSSAPLKPTAGSSGPPRKKAPVTAKSAARSRGKSTLATQMGRVKPSREDESNYLRLFHQMADAVFVIDAETLRFLDCNLAACQTYGYSRQQMLGMTPLDLHPEEEQELARRRLRAKKWAVREYHHVTRSGRQLTVEINTTGIRFHGRPAHLSIVHDVSERIRAQAYLEQLFESAPEGIAIVGEEQRITRVNREFSRIFGYAMEEVVGQTLEMLVPPDRVSEARFIQRMLGRGATLNVETTRRRKDGSLVDVSILGTPIRGSGERPAVYLIYRDITESKRAERAVSESESKFRAVAETAASAICIHDGAQFLYVNKACEQISGYTREELLSMHPLAILDDASREQVRRSGVPADAPIRGEVSIRTKTGQARWIDAIANRIQFEGRSAVLVTGVDMTERKRSERLQSALYRIAEQTSYAEDLQQFYAAIHGIIAEMMYAENFYVAIYDEDRDLLTFPYFKDAVDPPPSPKPLGRGLTEFVLRTGEPQLVSPERFQQLVDAGDVELIGAPSVDWLGVPMKKGDQAFGALVVQSYTDVARYGEQAKELLTFVSQHVASAVERKRHLEALRSSEAQLRQSQKMEAVGRLAGGVAHDFNNLLTVIKGHSELALEEMSESEPLYASVQEIQRAADRAASLTRQLLAFSRRQVLAPKVLDLNQLMVDAQKLLRRLLGEDIELITALGSQLGSVRADPHQIEQVLMNLAVNAKDAMPHGGKLSIETANVEFNRDYTHNNAAVKPGAYVMLTISDTGTGMDADTCARIF
ncbi:MAG: PAS domain S-box protein, partial [Acidobacteria bacterium]|nr:PAS domain S-box protein [Acidobacteriota bacterium]